LFSKERREEAIERGKERLNKAVRKRGVPLKRLLASDMLAGLASDLRLPDVTAVYAEIGEGRMSAESVVERLLTLSGGVDDVTEDQPVAHRTHQKPTGDPGIIVQGEPDVWVKLARCCTPVPGDEITGFITRGSGVSVHRRDCLNVEQLAQQTNRIVEVEWAPTQSSVFLVNIQIEALDRSGLLSDVTRALSDQHVNILSASVSTTKDRIAISKFTFEMAEPHHLGAVLRAVRGVSGVFDAYRV
jgi:GTP pyrophosphokinase